MTKWHHNVFMPNYPTCKINIFKIFSSFFYTNSNIFTLHQQKDVSLNDTSFAHVMLFCLICKSVWKLSPFVFASKFRRRYILCFCFMLQGGRNMARVWVIVHIGVICAIGGGFLCIITNELEINRALTVFLAVTGTDFLLLIYFVWVVFAYSRSGHESDVWSESRQKLRIFHP